MLIGEYDVVMEALKNEMFETLQATNQASFVIKILKGDAKAEVNIEPYR
jgi:hypothetical protein